MDCIRYEIGSRIKAQRKKNNLSQEKLAELSNLNTSYIGQIERGEKNPSIETIYSISKALNIDIASLFENIINIDDKSKQYPKAVYSIMLECDNDKCKKIYDVVSIIADI